MTAQIAHLPEVERLSKSVIRILGGNPGKFTLQGTNTYLLGTGSRRLLVDTGEGKASWIQALKVTLKEQNAEVSDVIITHWHHDHQGGIADLLRFSPETRIYKHQPAEGQLHIEDGQIFRVDGASIRAVSSPGHAQDHMALLLDEEDAMFTGDNVLGHGTAVFEDLATYLASLEKMRGLFRGRGYPGHGPVIADGPSKILEYIRHRQQREDQVLQVLRSSRPSLSNQNTDAELEDWSSMEIVKLIYKDVPENLHLPAHGGIMQILGHKLVVYNLLAYVETEGRRESQRGFIDFTLEDKQPGCAIAVHETALGNTVFDLDSQGVRFLHASWAFEPPVRRSAC